MAEKIAYPYLPAGREYLYVPATDLYMQAAKDIAQRDSLDKTMPGAAVVVKNNWVIGFGANGSSFHETNGCERVRLGCKSGQGYELCEGCSPKNHSEATAIAFAAKMGKDTSGADLYLWGHWWCCKDCWTAMESAGIARVFLLESSEVLFNKEHPDNVVGRQFDK